MREVEIVRIRHSVTQKQLEFRKEDDNLTSSKGFAAIASKSAERYVAVCSVI